MNQTLKKVLHHFGLNEKEAKLYLTSLELGIATIGTIARYSGLNRVTIYPLAQKLVHSGIIQEIERNNVKHLSAKDPQKLLEEFEQRYREFQESMPAFMSLSQKLGKPSKVSFYDGKQQVEKMLYEYSDKRIESKSHYDHTWRGYQDDSFLPQYSERSTRYWDKKVVNEKIHLLTNKGEFETKVGPIYKNSHSRIMKYLPDDFNFTSTILVAGEYIIMINTREKRHYAYQLYDKDFAHNLRTIFSLIWSQSETIS